jgi:ribosome-associated heat shock protein Hsp15
MNGQSIKPSKSVTPGDKYDIKTNMRSWNIEVTALLANRVSFAEAQNYYLDHTPEEDKKPAPTSGSAFNTGKRMSKIGRPTKKQRRDLDDFMIE